MVVAETRGLLKTLSRGDVLGRARERVILRQLQRENMAKATELRFLRECSAAQYVPGDTEMEAFRIHREESHKQYLVWLGHTQPHLDWAKKVAELEEEELQKDVQRWEDEWGRLDDPDVQDENERLANWLRYGGLDDLPKDAEM